MASTRIPASLPERLRPRKSPRQTRAKELVAAVLEAGSRILVRDGYEKLSMQQVATLAGVSPGSLYQYFPDKAALVTALVEAQSQREVVFHAERFANFSLQAPLLELLEAMVRSVVDFQRSEGALMRRTLEAIPFLGRYPTLAARVSENVALLCSVLEANRAKLPKGLTPELAAHVLANSIHSLTHDGVLQRPGALDDETLVREVMRLVRGYLRTA